MGRVAALGCAICRRQGAFDVPAEVHHQRTGMGTGKRAGHGRTAPLCYHHHRGAAGIHALGRKAWERAHGVTEIEIIEETIQLLGGVA